MCYYCGNGLQRIVRFRFIMNEILEALKDFVCYYALKLKLLLRTRQFDSQLGETAYRNIYTSIINGDGLEAMQ